MVKSEGDGFRLNHDSFVDILSYWLQRGSLRHKGGKFGRPRTCKGLFTHIAHRFNSQQPAGESSLRPLQKIIPDIVVAPATAWHLTATVLRSSAAVSLSST